MTKWSYLGYLLSYRKVIDHFGILGKNWRRNFDLTFLNFQRKKALKGPWSWCIKNRWRPEKARFPKYPIMDFDFLVKMGGIHPWGCYIKNLQTPFSVFLRKIALKLNNWFLPFFQASALKWPILGHFSINLPLEYYPGTSFRQSKPILAFKDLKNSKKCLN